MNVVMIRQEEFRGDGLVVVGDRRARHIVEVLKGRPGQSVRVGVLNGSLGTGRIVAIGAGGVTLDCVLNEPPPWEPSVDLILALPRPKVMKRLWAPLACLGVRRLVLVRAAKVERTYFETHWLDPKHYEPLLIEGLEQAGDTRMPEVMVIRRLKPFVEGTLGPTSLGGLRLLAHPDAQVTAATVAADTRDVLLAVGPEGGWTEFELELFGTHGFERISLGPRRLRTDLACTALISVLRDRLGSKSRTP